MSLQELRGMFRGEIGACLIEESTSLTVGFSLALVCDAVTNHLQEMSNPRQQAMVHFHQVIVQVCGMETSVAEKASVGHFIENFLIMPQGGEVTSLEGSANLGVGDIGMV